MCHYIPFCILTVNTYSSCCAYHGPFDGAQRDPNLWVYFKVLIGVCPIPLLPYSAARIFL